MHGGFGLYLVVLELGLSLIRIQVYECSPERPAGVIKTVIAFDSKMKASLAALKRFRDLLFCISRNILQF